MNILDRMHQMIRGVPNPEKFVMNRRTFNELSILAIDLYHLRLSDDETVVVQNFAGLPIEVDGYVPDGEVYLLGRAVTR